MSALGRRSPSRPLLVARRKSEVLTALFFFVIVSSLFPLGIGPEPSCYERLHRDFVGCALWPPWGCSACLQQIMRMAPWSKWSYPQAHWWCWF